MISFYVNFVFTDAGTRARFLSALQEWLPHECVGPLLYRGSRDGMTPAAFHGACDDQGPTLTLIRSENGYTFGGYSPVPWSRSSYRSRVCQWRSPYDVHGSSGLSLAETRRRPDAFLFSLVGPYCAVAQFPFLKPQAAAPPHAAYYNLEPIIYDSNAGPMFGNGKTPDLAVKPATP